MFGIGMPELILILAVALIVIGPKKLPDLAKSLGKAMGEFKKATNDIKDSMQLDSGIQEVKTTFNDLEKELKKPVPTVDTDPAGEATDPAAAESATETPADGDPALPLADAAPGDADLSAAADAELLEAEIEEHASAKVPAAADDGPSADDASTNGPSDDGPPTDSPTKTDPPTATS